MDPVRCLVAAIIVRALKDVQRGHADAEEFLYSEGGGQLLRILDLPQDRLPEILSQPLDLRVGRITTDQAPDDWKTCSDCGQPKPPEAFIGQNGADCKACADCRAADRERRRRARMPTTAEREAQPTSGERRIRRWGLWLRPARRRPRDLPGQIWWEVI